jgi:hypothetical protein
VPSKPEDAAWVPDLEVQMWWQPSLCAESVWVRDGGVVVDVWILRVLVPEAERIEVGVTARE